jgi:hypothetical protein
MKNTNHILRWTGRSLLLGSFVALIVFFLRTPVNRDPQPTDDWQAKYTTPSHLSTAPSASPASSTSKDLPKQDLTAGLIIRSQNNHSLPSEMSLILETHDHALLTTTASKKNDSADLSFETTTMNLRNVTILHPEYETQTTLLLDPSRRDGTAGVVLCAPAPKINISGLSELSLGDKGLLASALFLHFPLPQNWDSDLLARFVPILSTSKAWQNLSWSPGQENLYLKVPIPPNLSLDSIALHAPSSGPGILRILNKESFDMLPPQRLELRSGETTHIDLRQLKLARLTATINPPSAWNAQIKIKISQREDSGLWNHTHTFFCEANGEIAVVGLRPLETRLSLCHSASPSMDLLPTERVLLLEPGENHVENVFGSAHEFLVRAETEKTAYGHYATVEFGVFQDGRILDHDGLVLANGQWRLCAWASDTVKLTYKTWLDGFACADFISETVLLAPGQDELSFKSHPGSALRLSGLDWGNQRTMLVLRNGTLLKVIDSSRGDRADERAFALPEGTLQLIFLQDDLSIMNGRYGTEIRLSSPPLKPEQQRHFLTTKYTNTHENVPHQ